MRQISRRKTNKTLITCIPSVYMWETQEYWVTPQNGQSHHLKYHLQLKTKDVGGGESVVGAYQEKHSKQELRLLYRAKSLLSPLTRVSRDLESTPSSWYSKGDTLTNGHFPYKCKCLLQKDNFFSVFRGCVMFAVLNWYSTSGKDFKFYLNQAHPPKINYYLQAFYMYLQSTL